MKLQPTRKIRQTIAATGLCAALSAFTGTAYAAPLNITNDPLFLSDSVAPGIFIMMDDSGSMDWEVLVGRHYRYASYYKDASWEITNGLWSAFSNPGNCTGWRNYTYIFDNNDDLYNCGSATLETNPNAYARDWRGLSADFNFMYFDPEKTYKPWQAKVDDSSNESAQSFPDADFSSVRSNPQPGETGYSDLKNLDGFIYEVADTNSYGFCGTSPDGPEVDYEHNRCSSDADCDDNVQCTTELVDLWDDHTRYTVSGSTITVDRITYSPPSTDNGNCPSDDNDPIDTTLNTCLGRTVTPQASITDAAQVAAIKQNIANWYQYNRKRSYVAKAAVASVLENAPFYRFGMGTLHNEFFVGLPASDVTDYIPNNQDLYNKFAEWNWQAQGTPLRAGLDIAGKYFQGLRSGYTGSDKPIAHQCQQNFTILFTDGYYNGSTPSGFSDEDNDGISYTLADLAMKYYETDLDGGFANVVPTTDFDTQNQQHMVTFTVAFGVTGDLVDTDGDGWPNPVLAENDRWAAGSSINTNPERIDDMWHAAYNSKGAFISAKTPSRVVEGLNDALSAIQDRVGTASSAAASTGASVLTETNVFFAFYDSNDWSGDLVAYDIVTDADQQSNFNDSIKASTNFYASPRTKFFSWDPAANSAIDFAWDSLNAAQKAYLNDDPDSVSIDDDTFGDKRLAFIKGDTSYDGQDVDPGDEETVFRNRGGKTLGDILNSSPQFVGGTLDADGQPLAFINPDLSEGSSYSTYQTSKSGRTHMIYVGANDGILHGIMVDSNPSSTAATAAQLTPPGTLSSYLEDFGKEAFAYTPSAVIKRLNKLTSTEYTKRGIASHRYLVDGSPSIGDAYVSGSWKTVLVSGLGGGGQGIYALDVSDGASVTSKDAVLWEFNDSDDPDLGYTYSRPLIVRLQDGEWYAIFGNGYNNTETNDMDNKPDTSVSTTGNAVLFLLKLSGPTGAGGAWVQGTDYYKLDTMAGSLTTPNGLATVSTLDYDRDQVVDAVYGGDLQGNLWRFDLLDDDSNINSGSFSASTKFRIAYRDGNNDPMPVFTTASNQPITSPPVVASHPIDGFLVIFGTGQYLESGDNQTTGMPTQSFYGIWDSCVLGEDKLGNANTYQINYRGVNIPATEATCTKVASSDLLQQVIVKQEIEVFTEDVDSNNDGVIDDSDTALNKNTEEVRISTGYKLLAEDKDDDPSNTQTEVDGVDQFGNDVTYYTYESETGWLNYQVSGTPTEISHRGWYLEMEFNGNNKAERNTNKPLLLGGTVFFNTYTPEATGSDCGAAGSTWIYSLNASDGRQLGVSAFDLNRDGLIDQQDEYNQLEVISARREDGYTPPGTVIHAGKDKHSITFGGETGITDAFSRVSEGRQTWRVIK